MSCEIEKEVDNLGRIVIPIEFRKQLGIKNWDKVSVSLQNNAILMVPITAQCALCGNAVSSNQPLRLCDACINTIKKLP